MTRSPLNRQLQRNQCLTILVVNSNHNHNQRQPPTTAIMSHRKKRLNLLQPSSGSAKNSASTKGETRIETSITSDELEDEAAGDESFRSLLAVQLDKYKLQSVLMQVYIQNMFNDWSAERPARYGIHASKLIETDGVLCLRQCLFWSNVRTTSGLKAGRWIICQNWRGHMWTARYCIPDFWSKAKRQNAIASVRLLVRN